MRRQLQILALVIAGALSMLISFTVGGQKPRDLRDKAKKFEEFVRDKDLTAGEYGNINKMTAQTMAKLPAGGKYIVDLTRAGAIYEFDVSAGSIDFKRVAVRTARGEEALAPRLEKALSKEELARWHTQGFRIGNAADFRTDERNPSAQVGFTCNGNYCDCSGNRDCGDMINTVCEGDFFACRFRGGPVRCICTRR